MTLQEHLLVILIEELGEMQKEISKGLRFGFDTVFEEVSPLSVKERVHTEYQDIWALLEILEEEHNLKLHHLTNEAIEQKKERVRLMTEKSRAKGLIT